MVLLQTLSGLLHPFPCVMSYRWLVCFPCRLGASPNEWSTETLWPGLLRAGIYWEEGEWISLQYLHSSRQHLELITEQSSHRNRKRESGRNEKGDERVAVLTVLFYLVYITICHMCLCSNNCYLSYKCHRSKYIYNSSTILWDFLLVFCFLFFPLMISYSGNH